MKKKLLFLALVPLAFVGIASANTDFCGDIEDCREIQVKSSATVVVESVTVTQQPTDGACEKDQRKFTKNLLAVQGKNFVPSKFKFYANPNCKYRIRYNTTAGCAGQKSGLMTLSKFERHLRYVELKHACGTLKVRIY